MSISRSAVRHGSRPKTMWYPTRSIRRYRSRPAVRRGRPTHSASGTVGGIMETHKIASMAEAFMVSIAPHNPLSPLSTVVCLHLDTVPPHFLIQDVAAGLPLPARFGATVEKANREFVTPEYRDLLTRALKAMIIGWKISGNKDC